MIAPKKLTSEDRVLDYLFMRKRAHRRLVRLGWFFAAAAVATGLFSGADIEGKAINAIAVFAALWVVYLVVTNALRLFRNEEEKMLAMEKFIHDEGYTVQFDDLEGRWVVEKRQ